MVTSETMVVVYFCEETCSLKVIIDFFRLHNKLYLLGAWINRWWHVDYPILKDFFWSAYYSCQSFPYGAIRPH